MLLHYDEDCDTLMKSNEVRDYLKAVDFENRFKNAKENREHKKFLFEEREKMLEHFFDWKL